MECCVCHWSLAPESMEMVVINQSATYTVGVIVALHMILDRTRDLRDFAGNSLIFQGLGKASSQNRHKRASAFGRYCLCSETLLSWYQCHLACLVISGTRPSALAPTEPKDEACDQSTSYKAPNRNTGRSTACYSAALTPSRRRFWGGCRSRGRLGS